MAYISCRPATDQFCVNEDSEGQDDDFQRAEGEGGACPEADENQEADK